MTMTVKFALLVMAIIALASGVAEGAVIRGVRTAEVEEHKKVRQLKKSGGGEGKKNGGGEGGASNAGGSIPEECPKMDKEGTGWEDGYPQCSADSDCVELCANVEGCCCVWHLQGSYCGVPARCNDTLFCTDPNNNPAPETVTIYRTEDGDEVIQTNDVKVQVHYNKDGSDVIGIETGN